MNRVKKSASRKTLSVLLALLLMLCTFHLAAKAVSPISGINTQGEIGAYVLTGDEAFDAMMQEELYIVALINENSAEETTRENWMFNLGFLQDNYDAIQNTPGVNTDYVDSYIEAYEVVLLTQNRPKSLEIGFTPFASYDRSAAKNYALTYAVNPNPSYASWSQDCANFVSQCLYAGGKPFVGTPGVSPTNEYQYWFGQGTNTSNYSAAWKGAPGFMEFWTNAARVPYKTFTMSQLIDAYNYAATGYALSLLDSNGRAYHTTIIVGFSPPDLTLAQHTSNTASASLAGKSCSSFVIYAIP